MKKKIALLLALALLFSGLAGCNTKNAPQEQMQEPVYQSVNTADAVAHKSDTSVYTYIGKQITIDMVREDPQTGLAYVTFENTTYELGMDFLSQAMVYNCKVPKDSAQYTSQEEVYRQWWKLYIQRWNYLAPEVPLYTTQDQYIFNTKLEQYRPAAYWSAVDAILDTAVKEGAPNTLCIGDTQAPTGCFRVNHCQSAADANIARLTGGYALVNKQKDGTFAWNMDVLASTPSAVQNTDGTLTYTICLRNNVRFSDGSMVTARDYLAPILVNSSPVGAAIGAEDSAYQVLEGYWQFHVYNGENHGKSVQIKDEKDKEKTVVASRSFSGVKLINDFSFSLTLEKGYTGYYYAMAQLQFAPQPAKMYIGQQDILAAQGGSAYLTAGFYAKTEQEAYKAVPELTQNLQWNAGFPYAGPYVPAGCDVEKGTVTLRINPKYSAEAVPSVETVTYQTVLQEQKMQLLQQGVLDVLATPLTQEEYQQAQELVGQNPQQLSIVCAEHAGYGKLALCCDCGPTSIAAVRRALMYTINRESFYQGTAPIYGPYHTSHPNFQAVKNEILLNPYGFNPQKAEEILIADGWIYNEKGQPYTENDTLRYKKLTGYELSKKNITFQSADGQYATKKINGEYYLPLAINYYGTQPNEVTDVLVETWQNNPDVTTALGMYVTYTQCDFEQGVYEYFYRVEKEDTAEQENATEQENPPKKIHLNAINFATEFPTAMYDYSWYWSIGETLLKDGYSVSFLYDEADYLENYK